MDPRERFDDPEETLRVVMDSVRSGLWTSMPGIIQSFNPVAITATVQPAIKGIVRGQDGASQFVNMPLLVDVPVHFPRGGGCTLTFPVAAGDECLVVFSARSFSSWWQSGGVQAPAEPRIHDLTDCVALVGLFSQATKIGGISTASAQLRSNDGATYIDLNPATQKVKVVAPGGFDVVTPLATFSNGVTITGLLTFIGGMVGSAVSGAAAVFSGILNVIGQITANGKHVDDTHTHSDPQGGNTGTVN
ncbi:Gp138 family membrane-puncturing spike protein [Ralstonia nicotianae]